MIEYYIYLGVFVIATVILTLLVLSIVLQASNTAIQNMEYEADLLIAQYNDIAGFIHTHDIEESAEAVLLYVNAIDARLTVLSLKANYSDVSKKNYKKAIKKFDALKINLEKTRMYILKQKT